MDTAELVPGVCARHVRHWTGGQAYRTPCCGPWSRQHRRRRMLHSRRGRRLSQPRCRHMYRHAPQSKLSSWSSGFPPAAPASDKHLSSYWPRLRQTGAARLETAGKQSNRFNQAGSMALSMGLLSRSGRTDRPVTSWRCWCHTSAAGTATASSAACRCAWQCWSCHPQLLLQAGLPCQRCGQLRSSCSRFEHAAASCAASLDVLRDCIMSELAYLALAQYKDAEELASACPGEHEDDH